jgi:hypothetical protein
MESPRSELQADRHIVWKSIGPGHLGHQVILGRSQPSNPLQPDSVDSFAAGVSTIVNSLFETASTSDSQPLPVSGGGVQKLTKKQRKALKQLQLSASFGAHNQPSRREQRSVSAQRSEGASPGLAAASCWTHNLAANSARSSQSRHNSA